MEDPTHRAGTVAGSPLVVVAGEALIDLVVRTDGEILAIAGGSTFNSVRAIARLGVPASWIGGLSDDRFGRMLEDALATDNVGREQVQRTDLPTTLALAELGEDGAASYHFYTEATAAPAVLPGPLAAGIAPSARAYLTGSLGLVLEPMASTVEALTASVPADCIVMLDPNARPSITRDPVAWRARIGRVLARADIVKASAEDLEYLRPDDTLEAAAAWVKAQGPAVVLVTDGGRPVHVVTGDGVTLVATPPARVVDTVGAGDTFGGALLACLVHEEIRPAGLTDTATIVRAVRFAVRASAWVCGRAGADPPTLADLGGWPSG